MTWEAWVLVVLAIGSVPASVYAIGKVRTRSDMTINVIACLVIAWLALRLDGVL